MSKKKLKELLFLVILPMILGLLIYILSRTNSIYFLKTINLKIDKLNFDYWIKYNLPDGLWAFSITSLILIIWNWKINFELLTWIIILTFCSILLELKFGTFDVFDIIFILIGILTPFIYTLKINFKKQIS